MKRLSFISFITLTLITAFCISLAFKNSVNETKVEQSSALSVIENSVDSTKAQITRKEKILEEYGKLPLHFEPNRGQTDEQVKFVSRGIRLRIIFDRRRSRFDFAEAGKG